MVAVRRHPRVGEMQVAWNYIRLSRMRSSLGRLTSILGEHTEEVLAEAGLSQAEIADLFGRGAALTETARPAAYPWFGLEPGINRT
jgi:crotonobetainyl-CoA:carnitine CoA-transferase CaiB-like acyl-CoA transferase